MISKNKQLQLNHIYQKNKSTANKSSSNKSSSNEPSCCSSKIITSYNKDCCSTSTKILNILDVGCCNEGIEYKACIKIDDCDITKILDGFGTVANIEIVEYRMLDGTTLPITPPKVIGNNITLQDLINSLILLGWTTEDPYASPVIMTYNTILNITYIVINKTGANPLLPPYPYLIPANCSKVLSCPSLDPHNQVLIKKPDDTVCWTQICVSSPNDCDDEKFIFETSTSENGPVVDGPFNIIDNKTLRFWSAGSIFLSMTDSPTKTSLNLEANNMFNGINNPTLIPDDPDKVNIYLNTTSNQLFIWNPIVSSWISFMNGTLTYNFTNLTVDPTNQVFTVSPISSFRLDITNSNATLHIPYILGTTINVPDGQFILPFTLPVGTRPANKVSCPITFITAGGDYKTTSVVINNLGVITIGSVIGFVPPWFSNSSLEIYGVSIPYLI